MNKNGCYNRPPLVQGYPVHEHFKRTYITHTMTTDCQYSKTTRDPRCAGCKHEQQLSLALPEGSTNG